MSGAMIASTIFGIVFIIYLWPAARHWLTNGPKGSTQQWANYALLMGGVVAFVALLVMLVRSA